MHRYTEEEIKDYQRFVHRAACYNARTATDILVHHSCRLYSAAKVRELVKEFMKERNEVEKADLLVENKELRAENTNHLPNTDCTRAEIIITIVAKLPSYARICGTMIICALAEYLTTEQIDEQIRIIETLQDYSILWIESALNACKILKEEVSDDTKNQFIESEAEKVPAQLSCMRRDEYVEITFVD